MSRAPRSAGVPPASGWTAWTPLAPATPLTPDVLRETLDGGQAFRWQRQPDDAWIGIFDTHIVRLALAHTSHVGRGLPTPPSSTPNQGGSGDPALHPALTLTWSAPVALAASTPAALARYLDLDRDPRALADTLPWRSDAHLAAAIAAFPNLRILRQPFGETLLGFLCSATKQIVQIKQMVALLAARHGAPLQLETQNPKPRTQNSDLGTRNAEPGTPAPPRRLPTWPELAAIPEADLRACLLGFRARYISETAKFLAAHPGWLEETESLPYAVAKERLCSLPGVGEKVADCVLLFGAGKLEAFPVDVWIIKTMERRYGLTGWKPAQIAHFGRTHFGPLAGLAQQYLFAYERKFRGMV